MSKIDFVDENKTRAKIKVVGVGGCGGNAINAMLNSSLEGEVGMYVVNTDNQALDSIGGGCECVQIGHDIAGGLGVGADYNVAAEAARLDLDRLTQIAEGADMVFIAAGMGGGTGTGAAPVLAERYREMGILTVAVVTKPFSWENREENADIGIDMLSKHVDSIIAVPNDRIKEVFGDDMSIAEMFKYSDAILSNAVSGICEIIYRPGKINVDFADVKAVMSEMGQAMMGTATESGVDRAARAAQAVIECPLLEGIKLSNARGLLVNMTVDENTFKMNELDDAMNIIKGTASNSAKVYFGMVDDKSMEDRVRITLVATGLRSENRNGGISSHSGGAMKPPVARARPRLFNSNRDGMTDQGSLDGMETPAVLRRQHS